MQHFYCMYESTSKFWGPASRSPIWSLPSSAKLKLSSSARMWICVWIWIWSDLRASSDARACSTITFYLRRFKLHSVLHSWWGKSFPSLLEFILIFHESDLWYWLSIQDSQLIETYNLIWVLIFLRVNHHFQRSQIEIYTGVFPNHTARYHYWSSEEEIKISHAAWADPYVQGHIWMIYMYDHS